METNVLKISSVSNPNGIAGAIAGLLKTYKSVELRCVGAGPVNQAIKSIAIARGFVAPQGTNLVCIPAFDEITIDGEVKSLIKLIVKPE